MTRKQISVTADNRATATEGSDRTFFFILERTADFGEQLPAHRWPSFAEAASRALMEIREGADVRSLWAKHYASALVLGLEVDSPSFTLGVENYPALLTNLRRFVIDALSTQTKLGEIRELLDEPDIGHGHMRAGVLMVGSLEFARTLCKLMVGREIGSMGRDDVDPRLSKASRVPRIVSLLHSSTTDSFEQVSGELRELGQLTRSEMAERLGPLLNDRAHSLPQTTLEQKRSLAKWINSELRSLGLAVKCPKTGFPGFLLAHPGGAPGKGRFHLEVVDAGGVSRRTVTSAELPRVELMPADLAGAKHRAIGRDRV